MLKKIFLPVICLILAYGLWLSENFQEVTAGVAIFLFGMLALEDGFKKFSGGLLEKILARSTSTPLRSVGFGIVSTTLMQSSSLVSVITISFLSAGLLTLGAGIGIVFGANLGTTTGAWLIAGFGLKVNIAAYAMPMLVFGIILVFQRSAGTRGLGYILAGLGFLFLGIHHMKEGFDAFKDTVNLADFAMRGVLGLLLFTGIGIFATVVMQSSHATLVLIITALAGQQITYENALALAIGANIGTTITGIIGALGANADGKRLAIAHLIFNLVTGIIAIVFIVQLTALVDFTSHAIGIREDDFTLKLAVFHTIFNLIGVLIMVPFISQLVVLLKKLIKDVIPAVNQPKFLTDSAIDFPATAISTVLRESHHVYDTTVRLFSRGLGYSNAALFSDQKLDVVDWQSEKLEAFDIAAAYEHDIKGIYSAIVAFIGKAEFAWNLGQSGALHHIREANQQVVEAIKGLKHLQKNLLRYINGNNAEMQRAYDQLRRQIALTLRELNTIRCRGDKAATILSLNALKRHAEEEYQGFYDHLIALIREEKISAEMGTSLINDSAYTRAAIGNLISAAQTLFSDHDDVTKAARSITLGETEPGALARS